MLLLSNSTQLNSTQLNSTQLNSDEPVSDLVRKLGRQTKLHSRHILEIDCLLKDGRHLSAAEITSRIEDGSYSPRTIQRDIDFMRNMLNAPVESDGTGYYYGEPNSFIKSIPLTLPRKYVPRHRRSWRCMGKEKCEKVLSPASICQGENGNTNHKRRKK